MSGTLAWAPARRDPAWRGRVFWAVFALLALWPMLVASEFKPWVLWAPQSLGPTLNFLAAFVPPKVEPEFLAMVARETWRTVAMATAGITLALLLAIPLALASVRVLSVSTLSGQMARLPNSLRQLLRWLMIVLRSVPELIWALVFVRVVGLGPTAGVLAIALTYGGMLGKVYADRYSNAVFVLGKGVGVELRGTGEKPFHGVRGEKAPFIMADRGEKKVAFVESSIDAISLWELGFKGRIVSMSGNSAELAKEKAKIYREQGLTVVAAFDNDRAGEKMAANLGYPRERLYPEGKDWNDDLKAARPTAAERLAREQERQQEAREAKRDRSGPSMSR